MTDEKLKQLWGQELFDYCYQKSIDTIGYAEYQCMIMAAIGKIKDQGLITFAPAPVVKL